MVHDPRGFIPPLLIGLEVEHEVVFGGRGRILLEHPLHQILERLLRLRLPVALVRGVHFLFGLRTVLEIERRAIRLGHGAEYAIKPGPLAPKAMNPKELLSRKYKGERVPGFSGKLLIERRGI